MGPLLSNREQALLRGWINHLGWPLLGQLYLNGADVTVTRRTTLELRQRLASHARHCRLPEQEAFWLQDRKGGEIWLTQAESHLAVLLQTPAPLPHPQDPVGQWFSCRHTRLLEAAGLKILQDLISLRGRLGKAWPKAVPKFGLPSAQRIEGFLQIHAASLGISGNALEIRETEAIPSGKSGHPVIVSVFESQSELSGAFGTNRAPADRCRIPAGNDFDAVQCWLNLRHPDTHTYRTYRKEAERFLLWAVSERSRPLSSLDTMDCKAYRDFLFAPSPSWLNLRFKPRWSQDWRPFKGPLKHRNVKQAETILASLCEWLVKQRYLDSNPFDGLPSLSVPEAVSLQTERALSDAQWQWLLDYCVRCQTSPPAGRESRHYRRLWIVLQLAYCTGLRISELATVRFGDIRHRSRHGGQYWLGVNGKGGKWREVPLPTELAEELQRHARERGVRWGVPDAPEPLIGKFCKTATPAGDDVVYRDTPFTTSGLHRVLKDFFREAAVARKQSTTEEDALAGAKALAKMTAHWLRHTHASHALAQGAALVCVKENLGHASLSTTSLYLHGDRDQRHEAMGRLFRGRNRQE